MQLGAFHFLVLHFSAASLLSRCAELSRPFEMEHLRATRYSFRNSATPVQAGQCHLLTLHVACKSFCLALGASAASCKLTPASSVLSLCPSVRQSAVDVPRHRDRPSVTFGTGEFN
jgi:hypothetical protein